MQSWKQREFVSNGGIFLLWEGALFIRFLGHDFVTYSPFICLLKMFNLTDFEVLPGALTKHYGLTIELLRDVLQAGTTSNSHWTLHGVPKVEFYRILHPFSKNWKVTHSLPKTTIGKITCQSMLNFKTVVALLTIHTGFIEKLMFSNVPDSAIMSYGTDQSIKELRAEFKCCTEQPRY